jgi:RNA polymerase sigma-70 factor (ECF subfamily)
MTGAGGRFATTQWSLVLAAGEPGSPQAEEALARLCAVYWYPVFAFVRRQGHPLQDAQDLTQGFFARLIEKGDLADADRNRGRFRAFLLTACRHFLANEHDREQAQKRGGGQRGVPIDVAAAEGRYQRALSHSETPERLYDRQWCLTLLAAVLDDLREEYIASDKARVFDRLKGFLTEAESDETHAEAASELGMSAAAVKVAVHRLRKRYREALRRRVADTVSSEQEVEDEIGHLQRTLGGL